MKRLVLLPLLLLLAPAACNRQTDAPPPPPPPAPSTAAAVAPLTTAPFIPGITPAAPADYTQILSQQAARLGAGFADTQWPAPFKKIEFQVTGTPDDLAGTATVTLDSTANPDINKCIVIVGETFAVALNQNAPFKKIELLVQKPDGTPLKHLALPVPILAEWGKVILATPFNDDDHTAWILTFTKNVKPL